METAEARWLSVEQRPGEPLHVAAARTLREAICSGALRPGVRLPSSRALATQLGISRGVVTAAYGQLAEQGFLISRARAAPLVADTVAPLPSTRRAVEPARSRRFDLTLTSPDLALFPRGRWLSALTEVMRSAPLSALDYAPPGGARELREALADHLGRTRGVVTASEQIIVTSGTAQAIDLLGRLLARAGAGRIAVEDPSLDSLPARFQLNGIEAVPQRVDDEGIQVEGLDADAVLVTPAHQFPTGAVLSVRRRRSLLEWARSAGTLIVEDDHDAEFRYDRKPVRAMQGLDREHIVYLGTTSKTLAPGLRLAWAVIPDRLIDAAEEVKDLLDVCSPTIEQHALVRLLRSGAYDRHIRRCRAVYRRRRDALTAALERALPNFDVEGVAAGLHVLLRLPDETDDRAIARAADSAGVRVSALSRFALTTSDRAGLVIGYGQVHESAMEAAVRKLASVIGAVSRADDGRGHQHAGAGSLKPTPAPNEHRDGRAHRRHEKHYEEQIHNDDERKCGGSNQTAATVQQPHACNEPHDMHRDEACRNSAHRSARAARPGGERGQHAETDRSDRN